MSEINTLADDTVGTPAAEAAAEITFADLGLAPELLRAVLDEGYTKPTPIQAQAIPLVISGKDIMGGAQTGTGKTASFTLPTLYAAAPCPLVRRPVSPLQGRILQGDCVMHPSLFPSPSVLSSLLPCWPASRGLRPVPAPGRCPGRPGACRGAA